jgi:hypothetical protein
MTGMLWATATMAFLSPRRLTRRRTGPRGTSRVEDGAPALSTRAWGAVGEPGVAAQALPALFLLPGHRLTQDAA